MNLLAIDPGPTQSAYVVLGESGILQFGKLDNEQVLQLVANSRFPMAIEMIASYGMAVGKEVFETCVWIGRFIEAHEPWESHRVYRKDVKLHLCNSPRANDSNVRQALIDKLGAPGTKKHPGPTYGITKDSWAALAVGVYWKEVGEAMWMFDRIPWGEASQ